MLNDYNEFLAPQLICSKINESTELNGDKSFRMDLTLTSQKDNVSPMIDTDRMSVILTSNRINSPTNINSTLLPGKRRAISNVRVLLARWGRGSGKSEFSESEIGRF